MCAKNECERSMVGPHWSKLGSVKYASWCFHCLYICTQAPLCWGCLYVLLIEYLVIIGCSWIESLHPLSMESYGIFIKWIRLLTLAFFLMCFSMKPTLRNMMRKTTVPMPTPRPTFSALPGMRNYYCWHHVKWSNNFLKIALYCNSHVIIREWRLCDNANSQAYLLSTACN